MNRIIRPTMGIRMAIAAAVLVPASAAMAVVPVLYEKQLAQDEEAMIIRYPIGGLKNQYWFNYRTNVGEAQKELTSDLRHATDTEDKRDAWDEYAHELRHERNGYVKKMAKKGYSVGEVYVGE